MTPDLNPARRSGERSEPTVWLWVPVNSSSSQTYLYTFLLIVVQGGNPLPQGWEEADTSGRLTTVRQLTHSPIYMNK